MCPAPSVHGNPFQVLGEDIIHSRRSGLVIDASSNAGKTWRRVDLEAGDWTRPPR